MRIETCPELDGTGDSRLGRYGLHLNRENVDHFRSVEHGSDSLATSPDAYNLLWILLKCLQEGGFDCFQPRHLVDRNWIAQEVEAKSTPKYYARVKLSSRLFTAFEIEPLEDGMGHAAEKIISEALRSPQDGQVLDWFKDFCLDASRPNFAASVLRCLARQPNPGTTSWRTDLVRSALDMEDAEIRDAAVQAAEYWGSPDIRNVLGTHKEPLQWLREYIKDVVEDLGE